jgi:nitrile hydratase
MNGGQDLGGMKGFGPIRPEPESLEPVFHAPWERRVFGITLALQALGLWSVDAFRHARERQHPADYLRHSYYENWDAGNRTLLLESGLITTAELVSGDATGPSDPAIQQRMLKPDRVAAVLAKGNPATTDDAVTPRFRCGDWVCARNRHPQGHTREPHYVRGHQGVVIAQLGSHVFPDRSAEGVRQGQSLYSVRFESEELWGPASGPGHAVYVCLWEDYLEAVDTVHDR